MQFAGKVAVAADQTAVWSFLTDPAAVVACAPGVESWRVVEENKRFDLIVVVGPARFVVAAEWLDLQPQTRAEMVARGKLPVGGIEISSTMGLTAVTPQNTLIDWQATITLERNFPAFLMPMMHGAAKQMITAFFTCAKRKLEGG